MDGVVLPLTILTNDADVEFWLDEYSISIQHHIPFCVTMIEMCCLNVVTNGYIQMQSCMLKIVKEKNEDHHAKAQLYDPSLYHLVEPTNSQVPAIRDLANNHNDIHEQLNHWEEDAMRLGEAMAFYDEKTNLNSDEDHSMSDNDCNNDNYDTMSQLIRREKVGIAREKQKLQVVIPEQVEASKVTKTPGTSSSHVRKITILEHDRKWNSQIFRDEDVPKNENAAVDSSFPSSSGARTRTIKVG
ncbi:hypothetical protein TorRG33x02_312880 [Trema orientale]|uniref:Uncharacterized protein n=1 Tax=Trema orientale TaxID=63057 RepID=A0A2P5BQ03_TREOI|nr:hypothetical protein TorRG33x02_312880 [Trema orientale]